MTDKIRVLLADDHAVVRAGLASVLQAEPDVEIVGEAQDGLEAIEKARKFSPDVVLMDILMPRCSGLEAMVTIKEDLPDVRVLILTVSDREEDLFKALRFGAEGYLLKSANIVEVTEALRHVVAGETSLSPYIVGKLVEEFRQKANGPTLSLREAEILQMAGEGLTNAEIARRLFVSESTVRTYISRLMGKLHLNNRAEAIIYACNHPASLVAAR